MAVDTVHKLRRLRSKAIFAHLDERLGELLPSGERSTSKLLLLPVLLVGVDLGLAGNEIDLVERDDLGLVVELVEDPDGEESNYTDAVKI